MLSTIPFLMVVPPIAGLLIGRFIDRKLDTQPAFTIVFLVLGFAAGVREVAIVLKRANARDNDGDKRDRRAP
jgi:ATP synthase protein I